MSIYFQLLSEGSSSILEILKVDVITSIDVPMQVRYHIQLLFFLFYQRVGYHVLSTSVG